MLNPAFTFDRFFVGGVNELAETAARRAAESPGRTYNPLVICGPTRSGKTHLLHAIAHYATSLDSQLTVHIEGAEGIAERVTSGIAAGDLDPLNSAFSDLGLLLIDEVEQLSGMVRTQEELTGMATRMVAEGRQIVFASRMPPGAVRGLIRSFRELLDSGLVVQIAALDEETRQILIDRAAGDRGAALDADVIRALAAYEFDDVPGLRSAVDRLLDLALAEGRQPKPRDVLRILGAEDATLKVTDEFGSFLDDVSRTLAAVVETAPWRRRVGAAILRWEGEGFRTVRLEEVLLADTPPNVDHLLENFARAANRLLEIRRELAELGLAQRLDDPDDLDRAERLLADAKASREAGAFGGAELPEGNGSGTRAAVSPETPPLAAPGGDTASTVGQSAAGSAATTAAAATSAAGTAQAAIDAHLAGASIRSSGSPPLLRADGGISPEEAFPAPSPDAWFLNSHKVVLDWADLDGRLVEEPR